MRGSRQIRRTAETGYTAEHVSRTEEKGAVDGRLDAEGESSPAREDHDRDSTPPPLSSSGAYPVGGSQLPDETERTRLIADLTRLIHEPLVPEATRLAGLTLIGWLARRRPEESPHAIGIDEARESERRIRAARKVR